jgi:hypothetical protein
VEQNSPKHPHGTSARQRKLRTSTLSNRGVKQMKVSASKRIVEECITTLLLSVDEGLGVPIHPLFVAINEGSFGAMKILGLF